MKKLITGVTLAGAVAAVVAIPAFADTKANPWTQTIQVTADPVITLSSSSSDTVSTSANPAAGGFGTIAVPITVSSNSENGYKLTLSMVAGDSQSGALYDSTATVPDVISGGSGTLVPNQWGYTVVLGSVNTAATAGSTYAKVPQSSAPATLLNVTAEGSTDLFVNYGVVVDYTLPSGVTYANQVTYTASINPAP